MVGWWDVGIREQMRMRKRSEEELADENALIYVRGSHCWYCMGTVWSCIALLRKGHSAVENHPQERYTCTLASNRVGEKEGERKGKGGRKEEETQKKREENWRERRGAMPAQQRCVCLGRWRGEA